MRTPPPPESNSGDRFPPRTRSLAADQGRHPAADASPTTGIGRERELDDALGYNRKLWTLLVSAVIAEDNPLPVDIKRNILGLANFIFNQTFQIVARAAGCQASACWSPSTATSRPACAAAEPGRPASKQKGVAAIR